MNKKLKNYPFWTLCIALCFGVSLGHFFNELIIYIIGFLITIVLLISFFKKLNELQFIIIVSISFACLGAFRYQISSPKNQKNHISKLGHNDSKSETIFTVKEIFKPSKKYLKYEIEILKVGNFNVTGKALLSIKKDSTSQLNLQSGHTYTGLFRLNKLKPSGNPYVFEYAEYLKNNHITHQIWSDSNQIFHLESKLNYLVGIKPKTQKLIHQRLENSILSKDVKDFTAALVLGNKTELSSELKNSFIDAGIIHILAISGLHIGIFYFILNSIFVFFFPKHKNNFYNALFVVSSLWLYVWFIGSSPSATRATTMFTCFQISRLILREQHPINALFLSVFILILFDPLILFSVGFQLSVIAVASIILGMPVFLNLWYPENWIINKLWSLTAVSICAQIGILPISLFYFHQFSGVFLLANIPIMFIIPLVLIAALIIILCLSISFTPQTLFQFYNESTLKLFNYVKWVSGFENVIFKNIYINLFTLFSSITIIIFMVYLLYKPKKIAQLWLIPSALILTSIFMELFIPLKKKELWILNTHQNLIFAELSSNQLNVHSKKTISENVMNYLINPIKYQLHYKDSKIIDLKSSYDYKKEHIFILTSEKDMEFITESSIVVLHNSPKINLERLIKNHKPKQIITSNHNYPSFIKKWKSTCKKLQVDFYDINQKGALQLSN